jgi:hypothetical protein
MILPVARSAIVLHTPACGHAYPAGMLKIKTVLELAVTGGKLEEFHGVELN